MDPTKADDYVVSRKYNITSSEAHKLVREFNEGPYIEHLQPLPDAVEYVRKLHEKGYKFTVVTSLSDAPLAKMYRTKNLEKLFGSIFEEIVCLEMGSIKTKELGRWKDSGLFWIEDHPNQAEAGLEQGLRPILIEYPYNLECHKNDRYHTVPLENAWRDIYEVVTQAYK